MADLLVVDMDKMMEMILQPLFVAHLRFLQARASPMMMSLLEMEEVALPRQCQCNQLNRWMMTNMNKFQSCRRLLVALWNIWKNHLANNFHLEPYHLHYLYNLFNLDLQNNLDILYLLNINLHSNLLALLCLSNNDDDMNGKKLWCCQGPMVLQPLQQTENYTIFTTRSSRCRRCPALL